MSSFKDQLAADLRTFVNVEEFAAPIEIDGETVDCILDETDGTHTAEGVFKQSFTLYLKADDLTAPTVGQRMTIDGREADVTGVSEDDGLLTIRARWFDS